MCLNHRIFSAATSKGREDDMNNNGEKSIEDCSLDQLNISTQRSIEECYKQLTEETDPSTH